MNVTNSFKQKRISREKGLKPKIIEIQYTRCYNEDNKETIGT